ncbi:MAG TPA: NAD(P)/FAD-dependent oxidoreductase, partial [Terriglobia bacterium]|nr:NAD(P)/FAD-dependent oxidoreductase [Terriglobia bacterium]
MKINRGSSPPVAVAVVGAGAAGLMAAIFAASRGSRVLLLERTRDGGRKILISGGGRCNILPSMLAPEQFVTSAPPLLRCMLRTWSLDGQKRFFEQEVGLPLVLEPETGKYFPASNSARQVRDRLLALAASRGVETRFDSQVTGIEPGADSKEWQLRVRDGEHVHAETVIVSSGGLSVPATGSDGTGLAWARQLGHRVHATYPALTPLTQN